MSTVSHPQAIFDNLKNFSETNQFTTELIQKNNLANAQQDFEYSKLFLRSYRGSEATFNVYRREIERLLQWCWFVQKKNLIEIKREDIENFIRFCQHPPKSWIGVAQLPRFSNSEGLRVPNPKWRPFVATITKKERKDGKQPSSENFCLSQSAIQAIFASLSSFFNFLIQENYLEINPVMHIRQKSKFIRKQQGAKPIRRLSELQWDYVIRTVEELANKQPEIYERSLFIMSSLFGMYLRISELTASNRWIPEMGDFYRDQNNQWWFKTVGKGNKERDIAVSDAMLNALKRYRDYLGLASLPFPGDTHPLILKTSGKGPITDTRYIRRLVQDCFDQAIETLTRDGLTEDAEQLKSATVHWLRHTGISEDVKTRPREHVRDDAGHSSGATTDRYIDVELVERHRSGKNKQIIQD